MWILTIGSENKSSNIEKALKGHHIQVTNINENDIQEGTALDYAIEGYRLASSNEKTSSCRRAANNMGHNLN